MRDDWFYLFMEAHLIKILAGFVFFFLIVFARGIYILMREWDRNEDIDEK